MLSVEERFLERLATIDRYAFAVSDLMGTAEARYFNGTLDGELDAVRAICGGGRPEKAFWWLNDNYDSISACVRAAACLAGVVCEMANQLFNEATLLIQSCKEGDVDNGKAQS